MNKKPAYPVFGDESTGDPNFNPNNIANPYGWNVDDQSRGLTYWNEPSANSTMVSDSIEMTKRLKAFVPSSSVQQGRKPSNNLGYANSEENENEGNYKSKFQ